MLYKILDMKRDKGDAQKKESGPSAQEAEKKNKKADFPTVMEREISKFEKKLSKIENYEKMKSENKPLNKEMEELLSKKEQLLQAEKNHRYFLNLYNKSANKSEKAQESEPFKDIKSEESKSKELPNAAIKRLGYFFAITKILESEISPNPLSSLPESKKSELIGMAHKIASPKKGTCLAEMAAEIASVIFEVLGEEESTDIISKVMGNNELTGTKFDFNRKEAVQSQVAVENKPSPKKQPQEPIHEKANLPKETHEEEKATKREEKKISWSDDVPEEDEEEPEEKEAKEEEEETGDGFEIVVSKAEAKKKRTGEEGSSEFQSRSRGRGRGWGRGRGRGGRGERRGGRRGGYHGNPSNP